MKLKDIPGVMLGEKLEESAFVFGIAENLPNIGYNQAITEQGEVEVVIDKDKAEAVILDYLVRTQKERMFKDVIRARKMGKNTTVSESIVDALSDNLPSILRRKE